MATSFAFVVAIIAVNLLLGPLCLAVAGSERGPVALRDWGWSILAYTAGLVLQVATLTVPHRFSFFLGGALITLAPILGVRGVLVHTPHRLDRRWVGSAFAAVVALIAFNNLGPEPSQLVNIFTPTLIAIPLFLIGAFLLLRSPPAEARRATWFLALSMLFAVVLWASRLLFLSGVSSWLSLPERGELVRSLLAIGQIVGTVASTFALFAIEVRKMERALTRTALSDALTGLPNRRATTERFREEAARAQRLEQSFAMLLLDVDHFKRINDEHGHLAGDAVLKELARLLSRESRVEDALGRIGGEEFVLLLQQPTPEDALQAAERIRATVAGAPMVYGGRTFGATVSIGLALFPADGDEWDALFARADERLYTSKHTGRNRVTGPRHDAAAETTLTEGAG